MGRNFLVRLSIANPLNLPAVVYRKDEFEKVGLFREDLPFTADWEWYVRSALQVDWHHQPESLARYRVHALNQTLDLARAGRTARDIRRTVEIFSTMLPSDIAAQALPIARQLHAQRFLTTAMETLQAGNQELSGRYLYEALLLVADAASQPEFSNLLGRPTFSDLREELKASLPHRVSRLL